MKFRNLILIMALCFSCCFLGSLISCGGISDPVKNPPAVSDTVDDSIVTFCTGHVIVEQAGDKGLKITLKWLEGDGEDDSTDGNDENRYWKKYDELIINDKNIICFDDEITVDGKKIDGRPTKLNPVMINYFPFTEKGKVYKIEYKDEVVKITANGGAGELYLDDFEKMSVEFNQLYGSHIVKIDSSEEDFKSILKNTDKSIIARHKITVTIFGKSYNDWIYGVDDYLENGLDTFLRKSLNLGVDIIEFNYNNGWRNGSDIDELLKEQSKCLIHVASHINWDYEKYGLSHCKINGARTDFVDYSFETPPDYVLLDEYNEYDNGWITYVDEYDSSYIDLIPSLQLREVTEKSIEFNALIPELNLLVGKKVYLEAGKDYSCKMNIFGYKLKNYEYYEDFDTELDAWVILVPADFRTELYEDDLLPNFEQVYSVDESGEYFFGIYFTDDDCYCSISNFEVKEVTIQ